MKRRCLFVLVGIVLWGTFICAQEMSQTTSTKPDLYYLVVDRSGSIKSRGLVETFKKTIFEATDPIEPNTRVCVVIFFSKGFNNREAGIVKFDEYPFDMNAKRKLANWVKENYECRGLTPLYKTAADVFREVWKNKDQYRRIDIDFLTDGVNETPQMKEEVTKYESWEEALAVFPERDLITDKKAKGEWLFRWVVVGNINLTGIQMPDEIDVFNPQKGGLIPVGQRPCAAFRLNPATVEENQSVMFALNSTVGVSKIRLDFGDGSPAISMVKDEIKPVFHQYVKEGEYTVKVTAIGRAEQDEKTAMVKVLKVVPLQAAFTYPKSIRVNQEVKFSDESFGGPESYEWAIQGDSIVRDHNPVKTFSQPGEYKVTLTVKKAGKVDQHTENIKVLPEFPNASFEVSPSAVEIGQTIFIKAKSDKDGWHHHWTIGNKHQYDGAEVKWKTDILDAVQIIHCVEDAFGSKVEEAQQVFVKPQPEAVVARFTWEPVKPRVGDKVTFYDDSLGGPKVWKWQIGNQPVQTQRKPIMVFDKAGEVTITLTADRDGRVGTCSETIMVLPELPDSSFDLPSAVEIGQTIAIKAKNHKDGWKHHWMIGGKYQFDGPQIKWKAEVLDKVQITHFVEDSFGGSSEKSESIFVKPVALSAAFQIDKNSGKTPFSVQFTDKSQGEVSSWHWDFGDGTTSDVQNPVHVYENVGSFTPRLTIKNSLGAEAKDSGSITLTITAPMSPLQKALIGLGIFIAVWILFVARFILSPMLLPQKCVVLQGSARFQLRKLAEKGFLRWLIWPRNSIVIGTGEGKLDINLGEKTGKTRKLAKISRVPMSSSYSIKAFEEGAVLIIRNDGSNDEAHAIPLKRDKAAYLKDGDELEVLGSRFKWIQPMKSKGKTTKK